MRAVAIGVWAFVVGDDWRVAAGVVAILAATALIAAAGLAAWWPAPPATLLVLYLSLRRARPSRSRRRFSTR